MGVVLTPIDTITTIFKEGNEDNQMVQVCFSTPFEKNGEICHDNPLTFT